MEANTPIKYIKLVVNLDNVPVVSKLLFGLVNSKYNTQNCINNSMDIILLNELYPGATWPSIILFLYFINKYNTNDTTPNININGPVFFKILCVVLINESFFVKFNIFENNIIKIINIDKINIE